MCEILNQYCSYVFTLERPEGLMELERASFLNKVLITKEIVIVCKKLCSFKSHNAHGDDGTGSLTLKELGNELKGV